MNNLTVNLVVAGIRRFPLPAAVPGDAEDAHGAIDRLANLGLIDRATADQGHTLLNHVGNLQPT